MYIKLQIYSTINAYEIGLITLPKMVSTNTSNVPIYIYLPDNTRVNDT